MNWINPNDKSQRQFLPWIGESVLFCHDGITYYGKHTGGSFATGQGVTQKRFNTWECYWMYLPEAKTGIARTLDHCKETEIEK